MWMEEEIHDTEELAGYILEKDFFFMVVNKIRVAMYTLVWRMNHSCCIASVCMNLYVYLLYEGGMISCTRKTENRTMYGSEFVKSKVNVTFCFSI